MWKRALRAFHGDRELALRMIAYEKKRNPDLNDERACDIAIYHQLREA